MALKISVWVPGSGVANLVFFCYTVQWRDGKKMLQMLQRMKVRMKEERNKGGCNLWLTSHFEI